MSVVINVLVSSATFGILALLYYLIKGCYKQRDAYKTPLLLVVFAIVTSTAVHYARAAIVNEAPGLSFRYSFPPPHVIGLLVVGVYCWLVGSIGVAVIWSLLNGTS